MRRHGCVLDMDIFLIPVDVNGNHWVLVMLDFHGCIIACLDSLASTKVGYTLTGQGSQDLVHRVLATRDEFKQLMNLYCAESDG